MLNGRKRFITAIAGLALAGSVGFVPSSPAQAEPDIDDVQARVDRLFHQAEQASERYNDARLELTELRSDLQALRADESRQDAKLEVIRDQVADSLVREYAGSSTSAAGQLLVSDDPSAFLTQLSTMSTYRDLQGDLLTGGLSGHVLVRLDVEGDEVVNEERLFSGEVGRIRDVQVGPDGAVYVLTDAENGRLIRIAPED